MSTFGPFAVADLLADEQHRRLVALALADHDRAVDRQLVQFAPHGVDRRLVGRLLVALAAQARRGDRRALGDAHELERQDALDGVARRDGDGFGHGRLAFSVITGLVPVIPIIRTVPFRNRDGRVKPGQDKDGQRGSRPIPARCG